MSNNNASNKTHINGRRWDILTKQKHIGQRLSDMSMRVEMQNRLQKEYHVRTKPKLVAANATGGFKLSKHKETK